MPHRRPATPPDWRPEMHRLLRRTFALDHLREGQEAVIRHVMAGDPTIALMPTGAGKSLCYQLPALMLPGRTLVVSPLIALMKDQCDALREHGVKAVQLNSALAAAESAEAERQVADGSARIVFVTPERLASRGFVDLLGDHPVSLLVVDEAHCVSQWGHDFRPAFLEIGRAARQLGLPTLLALTATATDDVVADIAEQLEMREPALVNTGVYRPNLHYRVEQMTREDEKRARAVEIVSTTAGSGIVYTSTVAAAESLHGALREAGESVALYHGRLGARARREHQDAFMAGRARVMVATNAFGLGIDKPDTRFVLHYQMPSGLDAYYQESGRAGRDGEPADCVLLFLHGDSAVQRFFMAGRYPSFDDVSAVYRQLRAPPPETGWTAESLREAIAQPGTKLQVALSLLRHQRVVTQDRAGRLKLRRDDVDDRTLDALLAAYRARREHDKAMLEQMVFYGQTGWCRWRVLLEHFEDEPETTACGHCDNCLRLARARSAGPIEVEQDPVERIAIAAFAPGDRVQVARYGRGRVRSADAEQVEVEFPRGQVRAFLPAFVRGS